MRSPRKAVLASRHKGESRRAQAIRLGIPESTLRKIEETDRLSDHMPTRLEQAKALGIKVAILLCLCASISALEQDKRDHAKAGAVIGAAGYIGTALVFPESKPLTRFLVGSLLATGAGWAKELRDRQGFGNYEARDAWMTAGGGVGTAGVCFVFDWSF